MRNGIALAALATTLILGGCVAPRQAPPPPPRPVAPPAPPPVQPPASTDWRDFPITPGGWTYSAEPGGTMARFGRAGATVFTIRCDAGARAVTLSRLGAANASSPTMDITTSAGRQVLRAAAQGGAVTASLQPRDPLLDRMAFSRGRFIIVVPGAERLAIPSWPEFARVVEDCRG